MEFLKMNRNKMFSSSFPPPEFLFLGKWWDFLTFPYFWTGIFKTSQVVVGGHPTRFVSTFSDAVANIKMICILFCDGARSILQTSQRESLWFCKGLGVQLIPAALLSTVYWLPGKSGISSFERKECEQSAVICAVAKWQTRCVCWTNTLGKHEMISLNAAQLKEASCVYKSGTGACV